MSHRFALFILLLCGPVGGQQPPSPPAAVIPVPAVAPPLPGQLNAAPPDRIPDLPSAAKPVPGTPLTSNNALPSTSNSGQFIVHGNDLPLRSAFSTRCEEIHEELRKLLKDQQPWVLPIVVLLNSGEAARKAEKTVVMSLSQIDQVGFHLQVTVNLRPDLRPADFRAELIRTLLFERILRQQTKVPEKRTTLLPDWVYTGVMEALDYRKQVRPSALFAAIFKSGRIFGIEEIIEASPTQMDALSKTIYQTSCCALFLALLEQPEGAARLNRFLTSLASDSRPERELLNQAFPSFASSPASLNKWWALQLASLSRPTASEPLSPQDTVKALEDALTLRYQARAAEIPKPRPVVARITTTPAIVRPPAPRLTESPTPALADAETKDQTTKEEVTTEENKRSFFSRLNPFYRRKSTADEAAIISAIEEATLEEAKSRAEAEAKAVEAAPMAVATLELPEQPQAEQVKISAVDARKPLFNRWFGASKPTEAVKPENKPAESATQDTPTPAPEPEPAKEPELKKPSALNPLNWFRRDKPPVAPATTAPMPEPQESSEPVGGKPAESVSTNLDFWFPQNGHPLVAYIFQESVAEEDATKKKKKRFSLFGGDKKTEKKPEPVEEQKTMQEPPKDAPKKVKEEPKSTNQEPKPKSSKTPNVNNEEAPKKTSQEKPEDKPAKSLAEKKEPEMTQPAFEAKKEVSEAPAESKSEETAPKPEKPKRETFRLKSLFGPGKKPKEEIKPAQPSPTPNKTEESPPPSNMSGEKPAATAAAEEKPETAKPAAAKSEEKKPEAPKSDKDEKPAPSKTKPAEKPKVPEPAPKQKTSPPIKSEADLKKMDASPAQPLKTQIDSQEPLVAAAVPIEDYAAVLKRPDSREIFQRSLLPLNALQQRSAVLFRPIIAEYISIVASLADGKAKDVDERLRQLRQRTQTALEQSKAIRDQLDLHEANHSPAMSGTFDDYLKLPEVIKKEIPIRQDPISKYLDALDREFSKP